MRFYWTGMLLLLFAIPALAVTPRYDLEITRDLPYVTRGDLALRADVFIPFTREGLLPTVLMLHGYSPRGGDRLMMRPLAEALAAQGYAVVNIDYRPLPRETFPAQLEDARQALAWMDAQADVYRLDRARLWIVGASVGAQIGGLLANAPAEPFTLRGVVDLFGPMDLLAPTSIEVRALLAQYLGRARDAAPALYRKASPLYGVTANTPPYLILQGTQDPYVSLEQSRNMEAALKAAGVPVTLHQMVGIEHAMPDLATPVGENAVQAILAFFTRTEEPKPGPVAGQ